MTLEDDVTTLSRNVEKCLSIDPAHIPEQEGHSRNVLKNSASVGFNFLTGLLLDILFCWDVKPCLGMISRTAVA